VPEFNIEISPETLNEKWWKSEEIHLTLGGNFGVYCDVVLPVSSPQQRQLSYIMEESSRMIRLRECIAHSVNSPFVK
jgi:hypothetical protein